VGTKVIIRNRKAFHLYTISDRFEAGLALVGSEVKSIRAGGVVMQDAFAQIRGASAYLESLHINPYEQANRMNHDPLRSRKLLLHKREILKLKAATEEKGCTIVPLSLYFKDSWVKVELGVGKGKKLFDKRASIKDREIKRTLDRAKREMAG
jgi:SsrA-binding protein